MYEKPFDDEIIDIIDLYQHMLECYMTLQRCDMPPHHSYTIIWWLQQCKDEALHLSSAFDQSFMIKHLQRELSRLDDWLFSQLPTEKLPQLPLRLRDYSFDNDADTEKTSTASR